MKAQKCRLCGTHHHRWEPHQFPDVPEPSAEEAAAANEFFANMPRNILVVSAPDALADADDPSQPSPPIAGDWIRRDTQGAVVSPSTAEPPEDLVAPIYRPGNIMFVDNKLKFEEPRTYTVKEQQEMQPKAKFDRNAYQREYMKKWRKNRKP
jgi:hypothetical protein